MKITAASASSIIDIINSFELINNEFSVRSNCLSDEPYLSRELRLIWRNPTFEHINDLIVIREDSTVIGCCVILKKSQRIGLSAKCIRKVAFISQVVIKSNFRGRGYSRILLEKAIEHIKEKDCDYAIVIARQAVNDFYMKFGFFGVSSYTEVRINKAMRNQSPEKMDARVRNANLNDISSISDAYESTYALCSGSCIRSYEDWRFVLNSMSAYNGNFLIFENSNEEFVGYVLISSEFKIEEIGAHTNDKLAILLKMLIFFLNRESLSFAINERHSLLSILWEYDFEVKNRQCIYGGHMVKDLSLNVDSQSIKPEDIDATFKSIGSKMLSTAESTRFSERYSIPLLDQI